MNEVERMIALETAMQELLCNFFAENSIHPTQAAIMLSAAVGRLLSGQTGTSEEWRRNLASVTTVIESFFVPVGNEVAH